jgi:type II secretory pathway pseudopilin PulG
MKLNTRNMKRASGMTLLELTVVILVLLSLISILFIGARAWKRGSDRAGCIMNIRNVQQAVRSHANMQGLNPGDTFTNSDVFGAEKFVETTPDCPDPSGAYTGLAGTTVPAVGTLFIECSLGTYNAGVGTGHAPSAYGDW